MIVTTVEGFADVSEQRALRPTDEPVRRAFEATLTKLDRLLSVKQKLDAERREPEP